MQEGHMRKKILSLMVAVLIGFASVSVAIPDVALTVEAHSGRTDANGGHKDNKNVSGLGSYHYHCGGYPAHLHPNGVCPYASGNDQTAPASQQEAGVVAQSTIQPATQSSVQQSFDSVIFNAAFYAMANPDIVQITGTDPAALYQHFVTSGMAEGRQGAATFNVQVYIANNADLVALFGTNLPAYYNHYLTQGQFEGRKAY